MPCFPAVTHSIMHFARRSAGFCACPPGRTVSASNPVKLMYCHYEYCGTGSGRPSKAAESLAEQRPLERRVSGKAAIESDCPQNPFDYAGLFFHLRKPADAQGGSFPSSGAALTGLPFIRPGSATKSDSGAAIAPVSVQTRPLF